MTLAAAVPAQNNAAMRNDTNLLDISSSLSFA
jgi:hypothetical protein